MANGASRAPASGVLVELWAFVGHAPHFVTTTTADDAGRFFFEAPPSLAGVTVEHGYELRVVTPEGRLLHSEHLVSSGDSQVQLLIAAAAPDREPGDPEAAPAEIDEAAETDGVEAHEELTPWELALDLAGLPTAAEELLDVSVEELTRAMRDAVEQGVLDESTLADVDAHVRELSRSAVEVALRAAPSEQPSSRGGVLASLDLPEEQRRELLIAYQSRSALDAGEERWGEAEVSLEPSLLAEVSTCLELTELVGEEPRLIRHLQRLRRQERWATVDDLTELELEDWCELLADCYREDLDEEADEDADEAYQRYVESRANAILDQLEASRPSPYVRRALLERGALGRGTQELLSRAAAHDFVTESIRARVTEDTSLTAGLGAEEAEAAISELEGIERLINVSHRAEEIAALAADGLDSAHAIAAVGRTAFIETYAEQMGGRAQAARVHAQAQTIAAGNQVAALALSQARGPVPFVVGGGVPDTLSSVPQFRHLFAGSALCDCEHCGSVYSPAAYFVDLLRYLGDAERLSAAAKSIDAASRGTSMRLRHKPLDLLLARRPDLADIPLTCENTLTPLPYIDLVNEILEARVTGSPWKPDTGKTPADVLRAIPQSTNRAAYDALRAAVFPLALPYHEALDAFRAYLSHLGVTRLTLLTTFAQGRPDPEELAAESLGTSREELSLIVAPLREAWRHWGAASPLREEELVRRLTPATALMKATEMSFSDLVALCSMRFLAQKGRLALVTPAVDCDPAQVRVEGLTSATLERMLKLLRLRRRSGWTFLELDRVLVTFAATELDLPTIQKLNAVRELSERLGLAPSELLVLWAPLDTYGADSAFARLLQTRVVAWQAEGDQFRLRPDQEELLVTADDLSAVAPALLAAFRVTSDELAVAVRVASRRGRAPRLDLAGLSAIYRAVVLSRAAGLSLRQLDGLSRLVPPDSEPFSPRDPEATLRFLNLVKEVQASSFTPEQLVYLFLHEAEPRVDPTPKPAQVDAVLANVRRALVDAFVETTAPSEVGPDTLRQKLALLLDASLLDAAVEVLDPRSRLTEEQRREFFTRHLAAVFAQPEAAATRLFAPSVAAESSDESGASDAPRAEQRAKANAAFILEHLLPLVRAKQLRGAVVQVLGDSLGLSGASTARLLERVLRSRQKGTGPLIVDFAALLGTGLTGAYWNDAELRGEPVVTRLEPEINFSWAGAEPAPGVRGTGFSARYTGRVHPKAKGEHTFYVSTEGAVRLTLVVDGEERTLIERAPSAAGAVEVSSPPVRLDSGRLYELRLEYRNGGGRGSLALSFGTSPGSKQPIATTFLYPSDGLSSFAPVEESYRRLHKAALLLTTFGATDAHLDWLSGETRPIDLDTLPMSSGDEALAKAQFARFRQLAALYALRKQLPAAETDLFDVFRARTPAEASARLLQATGWDAGVVEAMLGPGGLSPSPAPDAGPSDQPLLLRLARAMEVQRRVGVSPKTLFSWASAAPTALMAREAAQAVKARYDEKRWLEVAKSVNDPLRLARRDALVAYLLPRLEEKGVTSRNQLFEYFLIDVDMNPCMLTSRIRQAIGSVQTYYQRCLMSLELTHPRLIDERAWQWMKNYRVWEANRKILLYPENWLEPELRDDKSPLFVAFERALMQDEIKRENVEAALIDYVQGLDEIARLDVRATCFEPDVARTRDGRRLGDTNGAGTYHVFARTFGAPETWFHRRLEVGVWTPWEKIEADIDGEHLVPVMFHDRLHLFWATFREVSKKPPPQSREGKGPILELGKDWEVHVAYAVYDRGRWSRKRAADGGLLDRVDLPRFVDRQRKGVPVGLFGSTELSKSDYRLVARRGGASELRVEVWRRRLVGLGPTLDPLGVTRLGEFILDGCNGGLRRSVAERVTGIGNVAAGPSLRLAAPRGCRVDGQGFSLTSPSGALTLTLPSDDASGHAALLTRVPARAARVILADAPPGRAGPLFFQTAQQCFFAHPVGPPVGRRVLHFSRFPQFGKKRATAPARRRGGGRSGRRGREEDAWLEEELDADQEAVDVTSLSPEALDAWEEEQDEAWHPEIAEARRAPRRPRPSPARPSRAANPPARRTAPARPVATARTVLDQRMRFVTFQHTKSCDFLIALKSGGIEGLFQLGMRARGGSSFERLGKTALVDPALPKDDLDFDLSSPYGSYNWELFFHAPLLVAQRLAKEGRHEEAQRFFHFVFDPTVDDSDPSPKRFWRFAPLKLEMGESARRVVATLSRSSVDDSPEARRIHAQLMAWFEKPFSPHVIARLRPIAYQKAVVMKYVDNLLAWGDRLFRQDTMESIQEATQLYVLSSSIMGSRPERVDRIVQSPPTAFREIGEKGNLFANWMVRFETEQVRKPFQIAVRPDHHGVTQALRLETEYFCVPHNTQLEKYWDTVQDRLHKIRNCMNIQGVVRQLPLFEPPLDPGMLARAAAAGVDLSSVVSGLNAPPPQHRFPVLLQRALTLAEELRSFGQVALKTLQQRDAEALAALRAGNEHRLQRAILDVRRLHVKQVEAELSELSVEREQLELKIQYLTAQTQELMNPQERASQAAMTLSKAYTIVTEGIELASKIAYAIPEIQSGGAGISSPFVTLQLGGQMFGSISSAVASTVQKLADRSDVEAELAAAQAEYQRRRAEWQQELDVLGKEKARLDKQVAATSLRLEIANKELSRHELELDGSGKVQEFLRTKFTSEQLYGWMLSQLASVHFQVYKFAFDAAQQAQRAFQLERGDGSPSFIEFAYWDSLKRGLFAGERLLVDLRRLEAAYLEGDRRSLEVTRHLSLRDDFPLAYDELLATGRCELEVTEALLDGDFPGHYARRIKTLSLSVSAPLKPFSNVNAVLTLLSSRVRTDPGAGGTYAAREDAEDARFVTNPVPVQAIATSHPTNDPGLFQLRFDDARYLPFEGAGAVSKWRLSLRQSDNSSAVSSFDDVVLSMAYTARDGGAGLESAARANRLRELAQGSSKTTSYLRISLRRDLPEVFQKVAELSAGQELETTLSLTPARLAARHHAFDVRVERVHAVVRPRPRVTVPADGVTLRVEPPRGAMTRLGGFSPAWPSSKALRGSADVAGPLGDWKLGVQLGSAVGGQALEDIVLQLELKLRA